MEHSAVFYRKKSAAPHPSAAGAASVLILLLLLTHSPLALEGAKRGLLLWADTVLPTLLPFMICSNVIVSAGGLPLLMAPLRPILRKLFSLSDDGGYVLVSGLLCGYPMGAKTCAEFLAQGRISCEEARYLLAISNHSSPMFVLGYLAANLSPDVPVGMIIACLYLPVLPLSMLARKIYRYSSENDLSGREGGLSRSMPASGEGRQPSAARTADDNFDTTMMRSIEVMVRIGGYIMLFSILAAFIRQIPALPAAPKALFLGAAEITTGIRAISEVFSGPRQGFWLTAVTAFGGLSGIFQTRSVLSPPGSLPGSLPAYPIDPCSAGLDRFRGSRRMETQASPLGSLPAYPIDPCSAGLDRFRGSRRMEMQASPPGSLPAKNAGLSIRHYVLWKLLHTITACLLYSLLQSLPGLLRL